MRWNDSDSIFARGFAVIIVMLDPEFFNLIRRFTPPTRAAESSISGSPKISKARSDVSLVTARPNRVSACPSVGANKPTINPVSYLPRRSGYNFARRGSKIIRVTTVSATVSDLPD